jgi:Protein of unknown function (DUF2892)
MVQNIGTVDRIARVVIGLAAIGFAITSSHPLAPWGYIGIVPLLTAVIGWCPAYLPFGLSTCQTRRA